MGSTPLAESLLYNSRIINSFLLLIRQKYSYVDIPELLEYAGMKEYEVADQAHWFKPEQVDRFYERLVQITGNPRIAREAGRYAASPDVLGAMRQYILGLVDAASTFDIISKATANFTRSSRYTSRRISTNQVEITVTPLETGLEKPYQCENRIGFFEAIVLMFNHKISDLQYFPELHHLPTIQHPECMFHGGEVCRYLITWERTSALFLSKARNVAALSALLVLLGLAMAGKGGLLPVLLPLSACLVLALALAASLSEQKMLRASIYNTKDSVDSLLEQIDLNYNNSLLTHEIGHRLGSYTRIDEMLPDVAGIMEKRLDYDRCLILLPDQERSALEIRASYGYRQEELACLESLEWRLTEHAEQEIYLACFKEQRPFLLNNLDRAEATTLGPLRLSCARTTGTRAFICCPITSEGTSLGVLAVESVRVRKPLVETDISLIMGLASFIGISIRNCDLIQALETANRELELRVAIRTEDLEQSRAKLAAQHAELERTYFELEEETAQRVEALELLREKERLLLQQSRLAALGEMLSNIAHQWRQPLNELGLIVQELPVMYRRGEFNLEYLQEGVARFMKVLAHLSKTIDDFRHFFMPDREKSYFRVLEVVQSTLSLIEESFRQLKIDIEVRATSDSIVIFGHANEFSQVILNLLFNARDAFVSRPSGKGRQVDIEITQLGEKAVVTVTDNAGGIPDDILDKIFDPYFTTRGPEQGTGIGLYMSKVIIEKNISGKLAARNVAGGAEFRIEV